MTRLFDISIETARRDLTYLEKKGIVKKIYGGATLLENGTKEPDTSERLSKNLEEKAAIGRKCAEIYKRRRFHPHRSRHDYPSGSESSES